VSGVFFNATSVLNFSKSIAYGKDSTRAYLENMIEKSDVRFVDKKKSRSYQL